MRKQKKTSFRFDISSELFFLCGSFLLGAVVGSFFASGFSLEPGSAVASYIESLANGSRELSFKSFFVPNVILAVLPAAGSFFSFGSYLIPIVIAFKGLTLSAEITCFIKLFGVKGYFPALSSMFISSSIVVSAILFLSCQSIESLRYTSGIRGGYSALNVPFGRELLVSSILCIILIAAAGIIHCYLMPFFTLLTFSVIH